MDHYFNFLSPQSSSTSSSSLSSGNGTATSNHLAQQYTVEEFNSITALIQNANQQLLQQHQQQQQLILQQQQQQHQQQHASMSSNWDMTLNNNNNNNNNIVHSTPTPMPWQQQQQPITFNQQQPVYTGEMASLMQTQHESFKQKLSEYENLYLSDDQIQFLFLQQQRSVLQQILDSTNANGNVNVAPLNNVNNVNSMVSTPTPSYQPQQQPQQQQLQLHHQQHQQLTQQQLQPQLHPPLQQQQQHQHIQSPILSTQQQQCSAPYVQTTTNTTNVLPLPQHVQSPPNLQSPQQSVHSPIHQVPQVITPPVSSPATTSGSAPSHQPVQLQFHMNVLNSHMHQQTIQQQVNNNIPSSIQIQPHPHPQSPHPQPQPQPQPQQLQLQQQHQHQLQLQQQSQLSHQQQDELFQSQVQALQQKLVSDGVSSPASQESHMDENGCSSKKPKSGQSSKEYRKKKKEHTQIIEDRVKQLVDENQRLRVENESMKKVTVAEIMKPDDFHNVLIEVQHLLVKLAEKVVSGTTNSNDNDRIVDQLIQFSQFSQQLRSTIVEREIIKIIHPFTQGKLAVMGYKANVEYSAICGKPVVSAHWWPDFAEESFMSDEQRMTAESLYQQYLTIFNELKEERMALETEIREKYLREFSFGYNRWSETNYPAQTGGDDNWTFPPGAYPPGNPMDNTSTGCGGSITNNNSNGADSNKHHQYNPYPHSHGHHLSMHINGPLASKIPAVLDFTRLLERLKMNFIKHRMNICDIDQRLHKILTPMQIARLIVRQHSVSFYDVTLVDAVTKVWTTLHSANPADPTVQKLLPNEQGRFQFFDSVMRDRSIQHKAETLKEIYEHLYHNISGLTPPNPTAPSPMSSSSSTNDSSPRSDEANKP
ncbi:hypothetical protein SAMD00019534_018580 [Acytostelium subglobosum LB1]|uniref:hypothetical protein n=1 Tax=Acytostelium subglobosum LB1 TaxID=1410327 RepID=UPI00064501B5|nr:hypothetical protein SAMD00019534_018580 [Acytostelium subglobosum LB1]GAM18683.1 hypothetical protein SAMD00019534_018580 [Acytostelium subglobosum LB1]|eukprot:XP_012757903.1 hypothetical protein SAMD00019534_018580 [Acytostelium subglobosum LB1]